MNPFLADISRELEERRVRSRLRTLRQGTALKDGYVLLEGQRALNLSSNNYLGIAEELPAAEISLPAGATASRLVTGNHPEYTQLEEKMALLKGTEACLVFGNGYMANVGTISALVERGDAVFSDRLNHASITDGIVLSRARHFRYRHNDLNHLETLLQRSTAFRRRLIVTDSLFSMDGDVAHLAELVALKERYAAALMVDEAHSGGVFGNGGRGLVHARGLTAKVEILMGTFSKAYGCYGGYVCGTRTLIEALINQARSFIYTTGLPPSLIRTISVAVDLATRDEWRREQLHGNAALLRASFVQAGLDIGQSSTQIIPWIIGDDAEALRVSNELLRHGVAALAIRPPTVPEGTARIRFSVMATHDPDELCKVAVLCEEIKRQKP